MDQKLLVGPDIDASQCLVRLMDEAALTPRAVAWIYNEDTDSWRLWIVPAETVSEKREFYRKLSVIVAKNRSVLGGLDTSSTQFMAPDHPAIQALGSIFRHEGIGNIQLSNSVLNGYYLPDAIVIRMAL